MGTGFLRAVRARIPALVVLGALMLSVPVRAAEVPVISDITHGQHDDKVRLMFSVAPDPVFTAFTVPDPDRLIIDFPAFDWQVPEEALGELPYISSVRHGLFRRDRARIVMELARPVVMERIFVQPTRGDEPGRLVIDLAPVSREVFRARAGWPAAARWSGEAPVPPAPASGEIVVAIDPGHGGVDPGASQGRLKEKTIVLAYAKVLARELEARPGYRAYLTRDRDEFVPLHERIARAHAAGANIMLSIHADSLLEGRASGMSAYTLSRRGSDAAATALAERENRVDVLAGADLGGEADDITRLLVELAQRGTQDESGKLALAIIDALRGNLKLLRTRPIRQANFRVLKAPDIPSVLLELGFLDSAADRQRLTDPDWQALSARHVADGIAAWRKRASPGFLTKRD